MKNEIRSTAHSKYRCEYHIVFVPKYRRKEIYGQLKRDIGEILRKLCEQKGVEIIEAEICPDHVHMLVRIPPSMSVEYYGAAEPPVRCGESHLSGLTEPPQFVY